jgi:hypothetical protein
MLLAIGKSIFTNFDTLFEKTNPFHSINASIQAVLAITKTHFELTGYSVINVQTKRFLCRFAAGTPVHTAVPQKPTDLEDFVIQL